MLQEEPNGKDSQADELLRRALLDESSSVAVSLRIEGLPLSDAVTAIFHGRRDLGTLQTYVTPGTRGAGATVAANELLRIPCDLDLADAEDRAEAEQLYVEQATALRDALLTPTWCSTCGASRSGSWSTRRSRSTTRSSCRPASGAPAPTDRARRADSQLVVTPVCGVRTLAEGRPPMGSRAPSRTSRACTRSPTTPSGASRTSSISPPSTRTRSPTASSIRRRPSSGSSSCI